MKGGAGACGGGEEMLWGFGRDIKEQTAKARATYATHTAAGANDDLC